MTIELFKAIGDLAKMIVEVCLAIDALKKLTHSGKSKRKPSRSGKRPKNAPKSL